MPNNDRRDDEQTRKAVTLTLNGEAERLYETLAPELKKLCANAGKFCDLRLLATVHEGQVALVSLGIDTKRKLGGQ